MSKTTYLEGGMSYNEVQLTLPSGKEVELSKDLAGSIETIKELSVADRLYLMGITDLTLENYLILKQKSLCKKVHRMITKGKYVWKETGEPVNVRDEVFVEEVLHMEMKYPSMIRKLSEGRMGLMMLYHILTVFDESVREVGNGE